MAIEYGVGKDIARPAGSVDAGVHGVPVGGGAIRKRHVDQPPRQGVDLFVGRELRHRLPGVELGGNSGSERILFLVGQVTGDILDLPATPGATAIERGIRELAPAMARAGWRIRGRR